MSAGCAGVIAITVRTEQYDYATPAALIVGLLAGTAGGVFFVLGLFRFLNMDVVP
jgi:hypothetical protein